MKKVIMYLNATLLLLAVIGCNEDEFLTAENANSPDAADFIKDTKTAEAAVFAIYGALQYNGVMGGSAPTAFEAMSVTSKAPHYDLNGGAGANNSLTFGADGGFVLGSFTDLYRIVDRANLAIEGINALEEGAIPAPIKAPLLGEAHFLRGLAYFWLATTFNNGSVPLITIPSTTLAQTQSYDNAPRVEVYNLIRSDFKQAQDFLPRKNDSRNILYQGELVPVPAWADRFNGRATWGTATSFLGKVLLYERLYDDAATQFKAVIVSGDYSLTPNFADNTNIAGEFNEESIFEVGFSQNPVVTTGNFGGGEGGTINETTTRAYQFNWQNGGWGSLHTSNFITELFRSDIADETSTTGFTDRTNASIAFNGDGTIYYGRDLNNAATQLGFTTSGSRHRKFLNWTLLGEPSEAVSEINERIMRLADVYLMYAEALMRGSTRNSTVSMAEAVNYIDLVRVRSKAIPLAELFGLERTYMIGPNNTDAVTAETRVEFGVRSLMNPDDILDHIVNEERLLEFAFEGRGITWQDLRRRPDAAERLAKINSFIYEDGDETEFAEATAKLQNDLTSAFFPIPLTELFQK